MRTPRPPPTAIRESVLLTNSRWMANVVQDVYDVRPQVVHPPVDTDNFEPRPWDERENGFVTVGRLARYKNVEETIRIVDGVRNSGHNVHHHIVGPSYHPDYRRELEAMADACEYVTLEGELPREELNRSALYAPLWTPRQAPRALRDGGRRDGRRWCDSVCSRQRRTTRYRRSPRGATIRNAGRGRREDRSGAFR
ncbi:glycosyltransferase [Natrinema sp. SYSU A 869]|uniref:glycosyltransferase n=1 Tax=Natrinema sp. SYSU A 869 TaxID=2871694 RepID=UPI001CA44FC9|nr:glycosyltransferase [Natrinema sp. SYSU A 869]